MAGGGTKRMVLAVSCVGIFLVLVRTAGLNPALPRIEEEFGAGVAGLQWAVNAYALVVGCLLLSAGALADRLGARRVFLAGLVIFAVASAFSVAAPTLEALIALQALLGVGGALLAPTSLSIIVHEFAEPAERANALGLWAAVAGLAAVAGPTLGGFLAGAFGWSSVFYFNVIVALVLGTVAIRFVPETARLEGRGFDVPGQVAGIAALGALTFAFVEGGRKGWGSTVFLVAFGLFAVATMAFVLIERHQENAGGSTMLPPSLFVDPTFSAGALGGGLVSFCNFGQIFLLSLFFAEVWNYSEAAVGLVFLPMAFVSFFGSVAGGRVTARLGPRTPMALGFALAFLGGLSLLFLGEGGPYVMALLNLLLCGFGGGMILSAATTAVVSSAPTKKSGIASSVASASRQAAGAPGVALIGSLGGGSLVAGVHLAGYVVAGLFLAGLVLSLLYVRGNQKKAPPERAEGAAAHTRGE